MASQKMEIQHNFVANTSAAKANIENLQQSLAKLSAGQLNKGLFGNATTEQIQQASMAAQELKIHLQNATNVNTGKLNLTAFQTSLKNAGTSAKELSSALLQGGAMGAQAFSQLATAIAQADSNVLAFTKTSAKSSMLFKSLTTAFTNQLTSKLFTQLVSGLNSAVSYAERLDSSLNSIRIVTHSLVEEMEKFATHATAAAQALSSTTTAYTDAALIYYQQGLRADKDIQGRTDVTIKMANVTGESAERVSEQLTAIWNNFSDYGDDFERYADIITALGASTASSTSEISQGLSKFAAIAQTVGLSYDYATSALATLVSATRQTPDTVGTALKTIFARLQGFKLGETLEDGVDLNKYSAALATVGVQAIDANGNLRDMDTILNDLASRWETLTAAQKMALAQTVAGVRQYTVLISLMDNWDNMKNNLNVAANAKGELQAQQDIYEQSWAAAKKRLKSTTEEVYNNLIDEQFMIKLTNLETSFTKSFGALLSGLGGVKAILPAIGSLLMGTFGNNFTRILEHSIEKVKMLNNTYAESVRNKNLTAIQETMGQSVKLEFGKSSSLDTMQSAYKNLISLQTEYTQVASELTPIQKAQCDLLLEQQQRLTQLIDQKAKEVDQNKVDAQNAQAKLGGYLALSSDERRARINASALVPEDTISPEEMAKQDANLQAQITQFSAMGQELGKLSEMSRNAQASLSQMVPTGTIREQWSSTKSIVAEYVAEIKKAGIDIEKDIGDKGTEAFKKLEAAMKGPASRKNLDELTKSFTDFYSIVSASTTSTSANFEKLREEILKLGKASGLNAKQMDQLRGTLDQIGKSAIIAGAGTVKLSQIKRQIDEATMSARKMMEAFTSVTPTQGIISAIGAVSSLAMGLNSVKSAIEALNNPDLSGFEKFTTVAMAVSMGFNSFKQTAASASTAIKGLTMLFLGSANAAKLTEAAAIRSQLAYIAQGIAANDLNRVEAALQLRKLLGISREDALTLARRLGTAATKEERNAIIMEIVAQKIENTVTDMAAKKTLGHATAQLALNLAKKLGISITAALTAVTLAYVAALALVVIGIVLLIKHFKNMETAQQKANRELQEAKQQTEMLKTASEDAATAVNALKESYDKFNTAQDKLSTLVKGTTEWKEALIEANQATLDLIENYPELAQYLYNDDGVLKLGGEYKKAYNDLLDDTIARQNNAVSASVASKQAEINAQSNVDYQNSVASNGDLTLLHQKKYYVEHGHNQLFSSYEAAQQYKDNTRGYKNYAIHEKDTSRNLTYDEYNAIREALKGKEVTDVFDYKNNTLQKGFLNELELDDVTKNLLNNNIEVVKNINDALIQEQASLDANTVALIATANASNDDFADSDYQNVLSDVANQGIEYYKSLTPEQKVAQGFYTEDSENLLTNYLSSAMGLDANSLKDQGNGSIIYGNQKYSIANGRIVRYTQQEDGSWKNDDDFKGVSTSLAADTLNQQKAATIYSDNYAGLNAELTAQLETYTKALSKDFSEEEAKALALKAVNSRDWAFTEPDANGKIYLAQEQTGGFDANGLTEVQALALKNAGIMTDEQYTSYQDVRRTQREAENANWDDATNDDAVKLAYGKEELKLDDTAIQAYSDELQKNNELLKDNAEAADAVATQNIYNKAHFEKLSKAVSDNADALEANDKNSVEYAKAIGAITNEVNDWLGTDWDTDEIEKYKDAILDVAKNGENATESIKILQEAAASNLIDQAEISQENKNTLQNALTSMLDEVDIPSIEIGTEISEVEGMKNFVDSLEQMVNASQITVDEANGILESLSFNPDIERHTVTLDSTQKQQFQARQSIEINGQTISSNSGFSHFNESSGELVYYTINGKKSNFTGGGAPSKSKGKGGGGGGSKKTKEKKPADNKDRYHTVDQQLEDLSNQLDELGDAEDRAFGAEKIKTMAREMAKLNEQVAKYNDKLVEAKNYLAQDRAKAEDFASKIGMSIQYGSNGEILNWDELKKGYLDWYNAGVDKYNAGGVDDDAFSKQYDDVYSDAMEAFDQLEETNNLVQELQQNILDTQRKYEDMYLAIQKEKLEINITIDENGMKLLEYFFDKLNDDLYDSVERMSILEDQIGNLIDQASAYEQNINGLLGTAGQWDGLNFNSYGLTLEDLPELLSKSNKELYEIFGGAESNVQEIIDQLQNDYEKLLDTNKQITETRQKLVEEIGSSFSSWNEEIDKAENKLEQNAQLMEHYRNVIDIVGRKTLGITSKFIKDYNIKQLDNDLAQLSASYAQLNEQREAVSALEQAIMRETSEETKALMQKELDDMRDALNEQVEDTAQKWEDCMRGIQEAYEDTVSVALDDWQTKMAGLAGSADMLQLSFDMATDIDDNYLDDYDKIYELSKLSADINNSIDDTDNIQSKEDLVALMEKVNELNESDADISQYTVDVLRARYELLKAEDALKEAQNAKSTVRLTQDNEGNWGYVYTADQDAVSQAEQEYADKLHALEEINQNYIDDLDQKLADLTKNASEKINQIAQDSTLTLEEKKEKIQEVYEYTNEMERYLMEQTQLALEDAMEIYEVDAQKYSELTGNKMLDDEKWVNSFEEMKIAQITGFTELQDWDQQFSDSWDDTVRNLITTTDEFVEKNAEAFDTVKMDIKNASEEMGDDLNQIADGTNKVRDSIIDMGADAEQTIVSVIDYAKTWSDEWSTAIDAIISKNELLAKSCDTIISKLANAQAANDALNQAEAEEAQRQAEQQANSGSSNNSNGSSNSGNYTYSPGQGGEDQEDNQKRKNNGGCFAPDTKVLMADLTEKEIQYIKLGDMVMSYDEVSQIFMPKRVTKIYPHYNTPKIVKIIFQDNISIELTPGHPILSQFGWRSLDTLNSLFEHGVVVKELQYNDIILGYNNNYSVQSIQEVNIGNNYTSYNLEVEDYHTFITNGIIAHNKKVNLSIFDTGGYTGTFQYADTGMYTGQWANGSVRANGRLAFLHQKELVLNAHDTENFLQAVDIVRNLNESLDLGALSMSKGLGNITARGLDQNAVQTIDQNVSIKAEFPNVQDRNEIEEAFNNLINKASQYANRKNK